LRLFSLPAILCASCKKFDSFDAKGVISLFQTILSFFGRIVKRAAVVIGVGVGVASMAPSARADDLWTTITTQVTTATASLAGFLAIAVLVPVAFYVFGLVKKGLSRAK
jgi:hypothetical protein